GVILQGPDGRPPGEAAGASGEAACLDGENKLIAGCGFSIKLYTADGTTLVAETTTGTAFGYGTLKLNQAPWDDYPAAAIIRVFANDRQLGPDHVIEAHGVDGLYP